MLNQQVSFGGQFYTPEVLILDDEPDFVDVMKDYVDPSAKVSAFTSPQEAMKRMESGHWPDVIVLDWMMPQMDGLDCLKRIRSQNKEVPVIMVSGEDDSGLVRTAAQFGVSCFLSKPFDFNDFQKQVGLGIIKSRLHRINEHLVRVLGDVVLGLQLQGNPASSNDPVKSQQAMKELMQEAEWLLQYRDQAAKDLAGVSF